MKTTIEYLETEVEELREKNENLECQVFDLEEQYKGIEIEQRQLWESVDAAFGTISNLKGKYENSNN